jgi:hypothetical protein
VCVADILARVERLIAGFPDEIQQGYRATMSQLTRKSTPGAFPRIEDRK